MLKTARSLENKLLASLEAKSKVTANDFKHLESFKADLGKRFKRGFVLYAGNEILPFGEDLWAVPLSHLS
jgi:hypothetical protein